MIPSNLRELFYDRNPGDARVKVGSERKVVPRRRGPSRGVAEIGRYSLGNSVRVDPPKSLLPAGSRVPKRTLSVGVMFCLNRINFRKITRFRVKIKLILAF